MLKDFLTCIIHVVRVLPEQGSKGEAVKLVQEQVGAYVDGDFGPKTEKSVKAWQKKNTDCCGPSDGIVGPRTWKCMFG